ncbi:acidic mammalian chitinase-like [Daphnia pulicaria]|uniref:acidic mammalian chitinase-like n=1 Tax=Daphnia pulicaria TaxID=35523 RepID=UPI001EEA46C3|nr:acidic mammalian chitinase-like [Daphnia pulicaria]XP_046632544.1 acidic mammalian chitinase-like [Daphnia pulicaria]
MKFSFAVLVLVATLHVSASLSVGSKTDKKKMVCYYGSWAVYRPGAGKFDVEDLDPFICTHIIYGFAGLGYDNTIISLDPYNDLPENWGKGAMVRFTGLKSQNPELKAILAIGGWNEGSEKYSKMVSSPSERAKFTSSVVEFLLKYNFDGLDFDWEYPANRGGAIVDKENFIHMIEELKTAFAPHGLMLTAAVSAGKTTIDTGYDIPSMTRILDQIHIMAYDFHGAWETFTGHNSPLYGNELDYGEFVDFNQDFAVNYWIENGADPSKLILGMGLYGRGFVLNNPADNGLYAPANQPISAGPYTREAGIWGYNEICEKFAAEPGLWTVVVDPSYMSPYAYKGNQWIGYDDQNSLKTKAQYAASKGLGGAMVWSVETDDFHGTCHGNNFILVKTIYETLNGPIVYPSPPTGSTGEFTTEKYSTTTSTRPTTITPPPNQTCQSEGYFRDPNDCGKYYLCVANGSEWVIYNFECGAGTVFDPSTNNCNFPYNVPGCENYPGKDN